MDEIKVIVTGRVQMVMFRDFAQRHARVLGLQGTVRNGEDGSVEVIAQGERKDLETLVEVLRKGPVLARVVRVGVEWREPANSFDGFRIIY